LNWNAVAVADHLTNTLTTWARDVTQWRGERHTDMSPAVLSSYVLLNHIDAIRRHPAADELLNQITDAIKEARRAIDRPADRIYLGQCYVENPDDDGRMVTCLNEIYGRPSSKEVTCGVCYAEHPVAERRAWLLQRAADMIVTVKEASQYLGEVGGIRVSQASIRGYVHRGRITYRPGITNGIRIGDLLAVVLDDSERKSA
jgi:hypothetical protein